MKLSDNLNYEYGSNYLGGSLSNQQKNTKNSLSNQKIPIIKITPSSNIKNQRKAGSVEKRIISKKNESSDGMIGINVQSNNNLFNANISNVNHNNKKTNIGSNGSIIYNRRHSISKKTPKK